MTYLINALRDYKPAFHTVVPFNPGMHRLIRLDFTAANKKLAAIQLSDTTALSSYVDQQLHESGATYGIGGYRENRILYKRSNLFDTALSAPLTHESFGDHGSRCMHLGIDIWGTAGTPVFLPLEGAVHSFAFNDAFGDYGATIIFEHQLNNVSFYTLYGHLSLADLADLYPGKYYNKGALIAHFGQPQENGHWPPHLHFQVISNMGSLKGDYPGVCAAAEQEVYFDNCPDPDIILNMLQYA